MNDCEIIDSEACGKSFRYCRTHKKEPHECPSGANLQEAIFAAVELVKRRPDHEFRVGDVVRIVDPGVHEHLRGVVCTVDVVCGFPFPRHPYHTSARALAGQPVCFDANSLELV